MDSTNDVKFYTSKEGDVKYAYTKTQEGTKKLIEMLKENFDKEYKNDSYLFGFDLEKTNDEVSTIQLSTQYFGCLFHVCKMDKIPTVLKDLLESEKIIKTGVGIVGKVRTEGDDMVLKKSGVEIKGIVDVSDAFIKAGVTSDYQSLDDLAKTFLKLNKKSKTPGTSWKKSLTFQNIDYAIHDAVLGSRLVHYLFQNSRQKKIFEWAKDNLLDFEKLNEQKDNNEFLLELKKRKSPLDAGDKYSKQLTDIRRVTGFYEKRDSEKKRKFEKFQKKEKEFDTLIEQMKNKGSKPSKKVKESPESNFSFNFL